MSSSKVQRFWNEEWEEIVTRKPTRRVYYEVSNFGRLRSVNKKTGKEKLLSGASIGKGYKRLSIRLEDGSSQSFYVHRLVAEYFLEKPDSSDKTWIIHRDKNKKNNHYENLKWVTKEELTQWHIESGVYDMSQKRRSPKAKMTEDKVKLLLKRVAEGKTKHSIIAKSFGISMVQFRKILKGESWRHVNGEDNE